MDPSLLAKGFAWFFVFIISTVLHEASHAYVAMKFGDRTALEAGQVTLDPTPHIRREPFGMILVPLLSFFLNGGFWMIGWASAPYDPNWERQFPKRSALMALAGPLSNLFLAFMAGSFIRLGISLEWFSFDPAAVSLRALFDLNIIQAEEGTLFAGLAMILTIFFLLNTILFLFNLIPVPPLDGASVIMLGMDDRTARKYLDVVHGGVWGMLGILLAWIIFGRTFMYVLDPILKLLFLGA